MTALWVFIGGGLGSLARYGISQGLISFKPGNFPIATLTANIISCVIIGLVAYVFAHRFQSDELKALLLIGFCGGFSTFSTFSNETFQLLKDGNVWVAVVNILISIVFCIGIIFLFSTLKK